mmetsp:Transcript_18372/g.46062  ORF Transcript_18372/g.46062 Transcript_18372/m.46062 type:complete len:111 (+) Transcript_18372:2118-2450(+)
MLYLYLLSICYFFLLYPFYPSLTLTVSRFFHVTFAAPLFDPSRCCRAHARTRSMPTSSRPSSLFIVYVYTRKPAYACCVICEYEKSEVGCACHHVWMEDVQMQASSKNGG